MSLADKIVVMRDGHILQVGAPMDLYNRPGDIFTARFIGSPEMNMIGATLRRGVRISRPIPALSAGTSEKTIHPGLVSAMSASAYARRN